MNTNEAPEKIYVHRTPHLGLLEASEMNITGSDIEYTRTDAVTEKACEFLKSYRQDTPDGCGYIAGIVNDKTIEDFKNYMKGE